MAIVHSSRGSPTSAYVTTVQPQDLLYPTVTLFGNDFLRAEGFLSSLRDSNRPVMREVRLCHVPRRYGAVKPRSPLVSQTTPQTLSTAVESKAMITFFYLIRSGHQNVRTFCRRIPRY